MNVVAQEFFGMTEQFLPDDQMVLEQALIAETIRVALWQNGGHVHVTSLRSWVTRKLRGLIPSIIKNDGPDDIFNNVLKEGYTNLIFIGDVLSLAQGYYTAAPTRCVKIDNKRMALISGLPSQYFRNQGINLELHSIGRHIVDFDEKSDISIQPRDSYIGRYGVFNIDDNYIRSNLLKTPSEMSPGLWESYQGNKNYYDFQWKQREHIISSPFGLMSFWRSIDNIGDEKYKIKLMKQNNPIYYTVPCRLFKHICLYMDKIENNQRNVYFTPEEDGMILNISFSPPEAFLRWLYACGSKWCTPEGKYIRWYVPEESVEATISILQKLPIRIEKGGK